MNEPRLRDFFLRNIATFAKWYEQYESHEIVAGGKTLALEWAGFAGEAEWEWPLCCGDEVQSGGD